MDKVCNQCTQSRIILNVSRIITLWYNIHWQERRKRCVQDREPGDLSDRPIVRRSFKTSCSVCHINLLMRSSISASLGGGLSASTTPQSVGKSKRWENENVSVLLRLLLLTFCVWLPYFCFPSLWLYLSISLYYVSFLTPFTDLKPRPCFSLSLPFSVCLMWDVSPLACYPHICLWELQVSSIFSCCFANMLLELSASTPVPPGLLLQHRPVKLKSPSWT